MYCSIQVYMYLPDPRECIYVSLYVENVLHESHAECSPCCVRWHASKLFLPFRVSFNGVLSCFAATPAHSKSICAGQSQAATCNSVALLLPIASYYLALYASTSINNKIPLRNVGKAMP